MFRIILFHPDLLTYSCISPITNDIRGAAAISSEMIYVPLPEIVLIFPGLLLFLQVFISQAVDPPPAWFSIIAVDTIFAGGSLPVRVQRT